MLRTSFEQGRYDACARYGIKTAAATLPTARIVQPGSGVRTSANTLPPLPGALSRAGAAASQFMQPVKRGLGLAALGGAGALAYGLHRQNVQDHEHEQDIYAPMTGTY